MNIAFLIGNGFDLNLGLKTKYSDFYKNSYHINGDDHDLIKALKSEIGGNEMAWADLEMKFGEHTKNLKDSDEFELLFDDIREKLSDYIAEQEKIFQYDTSVKDKYLNDLFVPYKYLNPGEKRELVNFRRNVSNSSVSVNVISFNYTCSLEKILDFTGQEIKRGNVGSVLSIEHIHGFTNERFIIGVDNKNQLGNEMFRENPDVLEMIVKPQLNASAQHLCDEKCKSIIDNAQLVCIFGMSIGESDSIWWNHIISRLKTKKMRLIICWKGEQVSNKFPDKRLRVERRVKEDFLLTATKGNPLTEDSKNEILPYIYVAYNSEMFKKESSQ